MSELSDDKIQTFIRFPGRARSYDIEAMAAELKERRALALLDAAATEKTASELWRRLLWVRHGCGLGDLYGDDGEMQCNRCGIDFKEWTPEQIQSRWQQNAGTARAATKVALPTEIPDCMAKFDLPPSDEDIDRLVDKFLQWRLPNSVCVDRICCTSTDEHRTGTNLLTATEAKQMLEFLLRDNPKPQIVESHD